MVKAYVSNGRGKWKVKVCVVCRMWRVKNNNSEKHTALTNISNTVGGLRGRCLLVLVRVINVNTTLP
jgi:hypothetical protein